MATRLYFSHGQAAPVSPAFGGWANTASGLRRALLSSKSASESLATGGSLTITGVASPKLDRQYVSNGLEAQTIDGSIKLQLRCTDQGLSDTATSRLLIKVVSSDGSTLRGTLLALGQAGPDTALSQSGLVNKSFADGDSLNSVACQAGDRLVIEIGYALLSGSDSEGQAQYGAPSGVDDLPEDETEAGELVPWIEFSADLSFQAASGTPKLLLLGVG